MRLVKKFKDNTSGNNGCAAVYAAPEAPASYAGKDRRPGHVFQGPDTGTEVLTEVSPGETGVWLPRNVTDRFVIDRLTELGMHDAADKFRTTAGAD